MMRKGDNMKNLENKCKELCDTLTEAMHKRWEHTRDKNYFTYKVGQKYIKIIVVHFLLPDAICQFTLSPRSDVCKHPTFVPDMSCTRLE